jgi:ribosome-associated protein
MILDVEKLLGITDCFIIVTGTNFRNLRGISEAMQNAMEKHGLHARREEASATSGWTLLDFGLFVVHLFEEKVRKFYDLEFLWADAPRVEWKEKKEKEK